MGARVAWQPSLLEDTPPVADAGFTGLTRLVLDEHSWVDHCRGWLSGSDRVFDTLAASARWSQRTVRMWERELPEPRLTAGWATDASDPGTPDILRQLCQVLNERYDAGFDRVWVNLYRDGADSVAWHGDRNRHSQTNPMVATVTLGASRKFQLRRRGTSRIAHELVPAAGDLLVMGGACQHDWEHTVPKTKRPVGARMSVTIRHSHPR